MEPLLLSVREAAAAISCSRATFYKLLHQGRIQGVKLGGRTLIPVESLKAYARALETDSPFCKVTSISPTPP